ncbi:MAG TPA: DUF3772 domain-containing protein [Caulobacteraceae bacterium]|jgi:small-conductance mechanosensitive channel|nr:DUF3772 domain-containing protein [Caulobacteraceae bacterium]
MGKLIQTAALAAFAVAVVMGASLVQAEPAPNAPAKSAAPAVAPAVAAAPTPAPATPAPPAAPSAPSPTSTEALDAARQRLSQLQNQAETVSNDASLAALASQAAAIEAQAQAAIALRAKDLAGVDHALKRLQPRGRHALSAADAQKQKPLLAERAEIQTEFNQAHAVASAANNDFNLIAERRREGFSARVLQQSDSPLSPDFWTALADAASTDLVRFNDAARDAIDAVASAPEPRGAVGVGLGLAIALLLALLARRPLEQLGRRKSGEAVSRGFARTAAAVWVAGVDTGLPTLAAICLRIGAEWGGLLSGKADAMAGAAVIAVAWASAILALGRVLATDADPSQRLTSMSDDAARRIQVPLIAVAVVTGVGFILTKLNYVIGASVSATVAADCVLSLAYAGVAGLILVSLGRGRAPGDPASGAAQSPIWTLVSLFLSIAIMATLGAVFAGYTTLAALISSQIFWLSMICAGTYLLIRFVDDLCGMLFGREAWVARSFSVLFGLKRSTISQAGLLVSAAVQLVLLIGAVRLALTPFGQSGELLTAHFGNGGGDIRIGSATISPLAIVAGIATLVIGTALAHAVQRWVNRRYLPLTDWDAGLRNSVSTGVGYLGVGVAVVCAMGAMGFGFQQIALIASALSVGIGFGLQQIVQNFVSGVILLVERPVKVGDWVTVDGFEGDIRRIRVRATEIQTFDRSTIIVPNSDLITKPVQNKTLWNSNSRVQIQLSIASPGDATRARDLILDVAKQDRRILAEPAPVVLIESLAAGGAVNFNGFAYVANPRDVGAVRSDLYFALLEAFQQKGIAFNGAGGPQNLIVEPGPEMQRILTAGAPKADGNGRGPTVADRH